MQRVRGHFQSSTVSYTVIYLAWVSRLPRHLPDSNINRASSPEFYHFRLNTVMSVSDSKIEEDIKSRDTLAVDFQGNHVSIFDATAKGIWRKIDIHLLPSVALLYLLSYL